MINFFPKTSEQLSNYFSMVRDWLLQNLILLKSLSVLISLILFSLIIYLGVISGYFNVITDRWLDILGATNLSRRKNIRAWNKILKKLRGKDQEQWRLALKDADKILDEILKLAGYYGDNLDGRLSNITAAQISNIEELRAAHNLTIQANRDPDFELKKEVVDEAIYIYRQTFIELRLLSE